MAFDAKTQRLISLKKLSGKAHTSNDKGLPNEGLPSGITMSKATIFSSDIPVEPSASSHYTITAGAVEFLRLSASFIAGSDTIAGRHGFELKLPDDYEDNSSNPRAGTYPYINGQTIQVTSGSLQLVPPSFANPYEAKVYHTGSGETRIFLLDSRDWNLDYFNGVYFQQDPPGTGDHASNPRYIDAYLYIGDYLTGTIGSGGGTPISAGAGISGSVAGGTTTLSIDIAGLSADSNAGALADSIAISDASDGDTPKRITLTQLQSLIGPDLQTTRERKNYVLEAPVNAGNTFHATNTNFTPGKFSPNTTDVLVNGQLLFSGTTAQVTAGTADYTLNGTGSIAFSFPLGDGDIVTTTVIQSGSSSQSSSSDFYLMHSNSSLPNARTLQTGIGIITNTDTAGSLLISSFRQKTTYLLTGSHSTDSPLNLGNIDFSSGSYRDEHIDIFVNGALMSSGSSRDYQLVGNPSEVIFKFDLENGDIVTAIVG